MGTQAGYKPYKKHINKNNPLGMGGAIAEAYGALLDEIWVGKVNCVAPRQFKVMQDYYFSSSRLLSCWFSLRLKLVAMLLNLWAMHNMTHKNFWPFC